MNYISHRLIEDMHICYLTPHLPQNSGILVINLDCSSKGRYDSKPKSKNSFKFLEYCLLFSVVFNANKKESKYSWFL